MFPENWTAVSVFSDLTTQWRIGFSGPTGLDYGVIPTVLRLKGVVRARWPAVFADLQVMEDAALALFQQQRA